jgi:pyridoxine 4-dehydrogenase
MPPGTGQIPLAAAQKPAELRAAVEEDLAELGLDRVHVVNLRRLDLGPGLRAEGDQLVDLDDQLAELIALRDEGKIGAGDLVLERRCARQARRRLRLRAGPASQW